MILGFFSDMGKFFSDNPWYLVAVFAVLLVAVAVAFAISGLKKKGEKKDEEAPATEESAEAKETAEADSEQKEEAAPAQAEPAEQATEEENAAADEKQEKNYAEETIYHVTKRKEDGKWQVKLQKGDKAIKLFNTQEEAYAYAKKLAGGKEGTVHLHKVSGQIRKHK